MNKQPWRVPLALTLPLAAAALPPALSTLGLHFGGWEHLAWWLWTGGACLASFGGGTLLQQRLGGNRPLQTGAAWAAMAAAWSGLDVAFGAWFQVPGPFAGWAGSGLAVGQTLLSGSTLALLQAGSLPVASPGSAPRQIRGAPPPPAPPRLGYRTTIAPPLDVDAIIVEELWNLPLEEAERSLHILPMQQMVETELPSLTQDQIRAKVRGLLVQERPARVADLPPPPRVPDQPPPTKSRTGPLPAERGGRAVVAESFTRFRPGSRPLPAIVPEPEAPLPVAEPAYEGADGVAYVEPAGTPVLEPPPEPAADPWGLAAPPPASRQAEVVPAPPAAPPPTEDYWGLDAAPAPAAEPDPAPDGGSYWGLEPSEAAAPVPPSPTDALAQALAAQPAAASPAAAPEGEFFPDEASMPMQWGQLETADVVEAHHPEPAVEPATGSESQLAQAPSDYWGSFSVKDAAEAAPAAEPQPSYAWGKTDELLLQPGQPGAEHAAAHSPDQRPRLEEQEIPSPYDLAAVQTGLPRALRLPPHQVRLFRPDLGAGSTRTEGTGELWLNVIPPPPATGQPVPATLVVTPTTFDPGNLPTIRSPGRSGSPGTTHLAPPTVGTTHLPPLADAHPPSEGLPALAWAEEEALPIAPSRLRWALLLLPVVVLTGAGGAYAYLRLYQPARKQVDDLNLVLVQVMGAIQPTPGPSSTPGTDLLETLQEVKDFNLVGEPDYLFASDKRVSEQVARLYRFAEAHGAQLTSVDVSQAAGPKATPTPAPTPSAIQVGKAAREAAAGVAAAAGTKTVAPLPGMSPPPGALGARASALASNAPALPGKGLANLLPIPAPTPTASLQVLKRDVQITIAGPYRSLIAVAGYLNHLPFPAHVQNVELVSQGEKGQDAAVAGNDKPKKETNQLSMKMTLAYYFLYTETIVPSTPAEQPRGARGRQPRGAQAQVPGAQAQPQVTDQSPAPGGRRGRGRHRQPNAGQGQQPAAPVQIQPQSAPGALPRSTPQGAPPGLPPQ